MKYRTANYRVLNYQKTLIARSEMLWPATIFLTFCLIAGRVWLQQHSVF